MDHLIDSNATRTMLSYLNDKLKDVESSTYDTEHVWDELVDGKTNFELSSECDLIKALEGSRMTHKEFQSMLDALDGLRKSLLVKKDAYERLLAREVMHHGFSKLPDEILSIILSSVDDDFGNLDELSRVCKRFRMVMLATPQIWANCVVSSEMNPIWAKKIIKRSRGLQLKCSIGSLWTGFFEPEPAILAQRARIRSLSVLWNDSVQTGFMFRDYMHMELPNLCLLNLRTIDFVASEFYISWKMPKLHHLSCENLTPYPVLGDKLTTCYLKFDLTGAVNLEILQHFLSSSHNLHTLTMKFDDIPGYEPVDEMAEEDEPSPMSFQNLRSLKIESIGRTPPALFRSFADSFLFTELQDLELVFVDGQTLKEMDRESEIVFLDSLLPIGPSVKKIAISLSASLDNRNDSLVDFAYTLESVPNSAEVLSLKAPWHGFYMEWFWEGWARNLQRLHFCDCENIYPSFLEELPEMFLSREIPMPKVEIERCAHITEEDLKRIFSESETVYIA